MDKLNLQAPSRTSPETHHRGESKVSRIPIKIEKTEKMPKKPSWIRAKAPIGSGVKKIKEILRNRNLSSVCEEAMCPNLGECFSHGTATFMIMGDICTRRCPFCDVAHGRPRPLDTSEPIQLAEAIREMKLKYVVITSVDRDDLRDGGAEHYSNCINEIRERTPNTQIEVLVPDYRGRMDTALKAHHLSPPDVFNHNLETVPRLYRQCRPGSDYQWSLDLLKKFGSQNPTVPTKSGIMLGLGETYQEVKEVMADLRAHNVNMLTLGQYLQPSLNHLPVKRFVSPFEFEDLRKIGLKMGFDNVASGPMVRSSYHADLQANPLLNN
tara:strand:- start:184 stop:1155 length:972 start_codon:yes stop_codon:yes gene_type:complete